MIDDGSVVGSIFGKGTGMGWDGDLDNRIFIVIKIENMDICFCLSNQPNKVHTHYKYNSESNQV